jgi:hypothetical protein
MTPTLSTQDVNSSFHQFLHIVMHEIPISNVNVPRQLHPRETCGHFNP